MPWSATPLTKLLGIRYPLIQAPMAGTSTPDVAAAVSQAGALGSIPGAALTPDELRDAIGAVRSETSAPFAVNLFAPREPPRPDGVEEMTEFLVPWRRRLGLSPEPGTPPAF